MRDTSVLLNTTLAGQIARKLDAQDKSQDNKISASIWNEFVEQIGTGRQIKNFISVVDAMNSITTYAVRLARQCSQKVDELAKSWLNGIVPSISAAGTDGAEENPGGQPVGGTGDGTSGTDSPQNTPDTPPVNKPKQSTPQNTPDTPPVNKPKQSTPQNNPNTPPADTPKYTTESIKVRVPRATQSEKVKTILNAEKQGQDLAKKFINGDENAIKDLNKDNIAYFIDALEKSRENSNIIFISQILCKYADKIYEGLCHKYCQINTKADYNTLVADFKKLSPTRKKDEILKLKNEIIKSDTSTIAKEKKEEIKFNQDRAKMQNQFNKANAFFVEVANNPSSAKITRGKSSDGSYNWALAEMSDGRWINVYYDSSGNIKLIIISHDTSLIKENDGTTYDGADIRYTRDCAYVDVDKSNDLYEYSIKSGYNWNELVKVAESIFGKGPKES